LCGHESSCSLTYHFSVAQEMSPFLFCVFLWALKKPFWHPRHLCGPEGGCFLTTNFPLFLKFGCSFTSHFSVILKMTIFSVTNPPLILSQAELCLLSCPTWDMPM
jgi:hypothetical protein